MLKPVPGSLKVRIPDVVCRDGPENIVGILRTTRLTAILAYLQEMTAQLPHWAVYQGWIGQLAKGR